MPKTARYLRFQELANCYQYQYKDPQLDLGLEKDKKIILELGCWSWMYTIELAKQNPNIQYIGVDSKSDRLCFGAQYCVENNITNTKRLRAQVDHINNCFPDKSIDEIWITFPDPRPWRDRQKLTSPKFQTIYKKLLQDWWIIHLKTDDLSFFEYSLEALKEWWFTLLETIKDIYQDEKSLELYPTLAIKTYYEELRLKEGRKVYYLQAKHDTTSK